MSRAARLFLGQTPAEWRDGTCVLACLALFALAAALFLAMTP